MPSASIQASAGTSTPAAGLVPPSPVGPGQVASIQLEGELVCPPLRLDEGLVLVATNDRRLSGLDSGGRILWKLDFRRQIKGPLASVRPGLVSLCLSGQRLALVDRRGRLAAEFPAPWKNLLMLPDGRWVALDPDSPSPRLVWLNPSGTPLFTLPLESFPQADWSLTRQGSGALLVARSQSDPGHGSARAWLILHSGAVHPIPPPDPSMPPRVSPSPDLGFFPGKTARGYTLRIEAPGSRLDFTSAGTLGHWLADNRDPFLCVWGDSRWKLNIFPDRSGGSPGLVPISSPVPEQIPRTIASSPFPWDDVETGTRKMELAYYRDLETRQGSNPVEVFARQFDLLQAGNKLPGRLLFLEDHVLELYGQVSVRRDQDTRQDRLTCIRLLSRIPSLRILDRVLDLVAREKSPRVVLAWHDFLALLPGDPDGRIQSALNQAFLGLALDLPGYPRDEKLAFDLLKDRLRSRPSP